MMVFQVRTGIRPGFQEMMVAVEDYNVSTLVVKDLSRFGREYSYMGRLQDFILKLSTQYENEQQEIAQLAANLEQQIEMESAQMVDMDKFFILADKYAEITELTAPIVNELISKIVVHSPEKRYSRKHITIEVFFTYVGKIRIPISMENADSVDIA